MMPRWFHPTACRTWPNILMFGALLVSAAAAITALDKACHTSCMGGYAACAQQLSQNPDVTTGGLITGNKLQQICGAPRKACLDNCITISRASDISGYEMDCIIALDFNNDTMALASVRAKDPSNPAPAIESPVMMMQLKSHAGNTITQRDVLVVQAVPVNDKGRLGEGGIVPLPDWRDKVAYGAKIGTKLYTKHKELQADSTYDVESYIVRLPWVKLVSVSTFGGRIPVNAMVPVDLTLMELNVDMGAIVDVVVAVTQLRTDAEVCIQNTTVSGLNIVGGAGVVQGTPLLAVHTQLNGLPTVGRYVVDVTVKAVWPPRLWGGSTLTMRSNVFEVQPPVAAMTTGMVSAVNLTYAYSYHFADTGSVQSYTASDAVSFTLSAYSILTGNADQLQSMVSSTEGMIFGYQVSVDGDFTDSFVHQAVVPPGCFTTHDYGYYLHKYCYTDQGQGFLIQYYPGSSQLHLSARVARYDSAHELCFFASGQELVGCTTYHLTDGINGAELQSDVSRKYRFTMKLEVNQELGATWMMPTVDVAGTPCLTTTKTSDSCIPFRYFTLCAKQFAFCSGTKGTTTNGPTKSSVGGDMMVLKPTRQMLSNWYLDTNQ